MRRKFQERPILRVENRRRKTFLLAIVVLALGSSIYWLTALKLLGGRRLTLVVQNIANYDPINPLPLVVFSIEPKAQRAVYLTIPANTLLDVPYGYKIYPASVVFRLGELDKNRGGGKLLAKAIENTISVAVDRYFIGEGNMLANLPRNILDVGRVKRSYFSIGGAMFNLANVLTSNKNAKTNLSLIENILLWKSIRDLRVDQIEYLNLEEGKVVNDQILPDGNLVKTIDKDALDRILSDNFQDSIIRGENISLEVVNATKQEKVASQFSRILEHMGAHVIAKTTAKRINSTSCEISSTSSKHLSSAIVDKLTNLYDCDTSEQNKEHSSTDISIILGEGFIQ